MGAPKAERDADAAVVVEITVIRTGGLAGLRREWQARAAEQDAPRWVALIEGCPWDAVGAGEVLPSGADRFMWRIRARCGPEERGAELPDSEVQGPWRELVDQVRDAGAPAVRRPSGRPGVT